MKGKPCDSSLIPHPSSLIPSQARSRSMLCRGSKRIGQVIWIAFVLCAGCEALGTAYESPPCPRPVIGPNNISLFNPNSLNNQGQATPKPTQEIIQVSAPAGQAFAGQWGGMGQPPPAPMPGSPDYGPWVGPAPGHHGF